MAFVISPVGIKGPISITCVDTWGNKLLLGTKDQGVVVYDVPSFPSEHGGYDAMYSSALPQNYSIKHGGEYGAEVNSVQTHVANGKNPIVQISVIDRLNCLLVLAGGVVSVYAIKLELSARVTFSLYYSFPVGPIYRYCFNVKPLPTICLASKNDISVYHFNQNSYERYRIVQFQHEVLDMALESQILYMISKEQQYCASQYDVSNGSRTDNVYCSENPILVCTTEEGHVFFHSSGVTSQISADQTFTWSLVPSKIVTRQEHAIGLAGHSVALLPLTPDGISSECSISIDSLEPLQFITNKGHIYIASSSAVFRLTTPFHILLPVPPPSLRSPSSPTSSNDQNNANLVFSRNPAENNKSVGAKSDATLAEAGFDPEVVEKYAPYGITKISQLSELSITRFDGEPFWSEYLRARCFVNKHEQQVTLPDPSVTPEDLLEAIGVPTKQINTLSTIMVYTIRQYAEMTESAVSQLGEEFLEKHREAVQILERQALNLKVKSKPQNVFGYMYVPISEYASIVESRAVKSPYVLFQEYVECEEEYRINHPWKEVYHKFNREAKIWNSACADSEISDADVFSYLNWRYASSIGHIDATAGSRAIPFCIKRYEMHGHESDVFAFLKINLTSLCNDHGGKIFHKKTQENEWTAVSLAQHINSVDEVRLESLYTPQACIVTPTGAIDWDNIVP